MNGIPSLVANVIRFMNERGNKELQDKGNLQLQ